MDSVRNLTGSPIAGIDPHELLDVRCEARLHGHMACMLGARFVGTARMRACMRGQAAPA